MSRDISVEDAAGRFLAHKRALGRKYHSEECELRLLSRFAAGQNAAGLGDLTPAMLEEFLGARPRNRPRSFNHLLGVRGRRPPEASRSCSPPSRPATCWPPPPGFPTTPGPAGAATSTRRSSPCATDSGCAPPRHAGSASATSMRTEPDRSPRRQIREGPAGPARTADRRPRGGAGGTAPFRRFRSRPRFPAVHLRRPAGHPSRHRQPGLPSSRPRARPARSGRRLLPEIA